MRVFMCAVGAFGFSGWAMKEMPDAQKRGSTSAPGMAFANSGAKVPCTVEVWQPIFSKTRPSVRSAMVPPPPSSPSWFARVHGFFWNLPGGPASRGGETCGVTLDGFQGRADLGLELLEPGFRALLAALERADVARRAALRLVLQLHGLHFRNLARPAFGQTIPIHRAAARFRL